MGVGASTSQRESAPGTVCAESVTYIAQPRRRAVLKEGGRAHSAQWEVCAIVSAPPGDASTINATKSKSGRQVVRCPAESYNQRPAGVHATERTSTSARHQHDAHQCQQGPRAACQLVSRGIFPDIVIQF